MTAQEKRTLIDRYLAAYNTFDVEGMMVTLHPDVEFENVVAGEVTTSASGADAFRRLAEQAAQLFSSRRQTVTAFDASGAGAAIEVDYEGVLASDLPNGMKTGETLRLTGRSEFAFEDGTISRIRDVS
jgi:ketosteroid isomerase-like protein